MILHIITCTKIKYLNHSIHYDQGNFFFLCILCLDPCSDHQCADGGVCQLNEARVPMCRCGPPCNLEARPGSAVCGSDFKDYPSECALRRESCITRQQLTIAYRGECSSGTGIFFLISFFVLVVF